MKGAYFRNNELKDIFLLLIAEKALCLICKKSVPVMKDYNLLRHFFKKSRSVPSLAGEKKTQKTKKLQKEFIAQQLMFKKSNQELQAFSHASNVVAYEIAK